MSAANAATLPPFSNHRAVCAACGRRFEIRVHFDRDCRLVRGDHFHRFCRCGYGWIEQMAEQPGLWPAMHSVPPQ